MHYVALSQVTSLAGLYLKDLNPDEIFVSPHVLKYMEEAIYKYQLKLSCILMYTYDESKLKVVYTNTRSYKHYLDVESNCNILAVDIRFLTET